MKKVVEWILSKDRLAFNLILVGLSWLGSGLIMFTPEKNINEEYSPISLGFYFLLIVYNFLLFVIYLWLESKRNDKEN